MLLDFLAVLIFLGFPLGAQVGFGICYNHLSWCADFHPYIHIAFPQT